MHSGPQSHVDESQRTVTVLRQKGPHLARSLRLRVSGFSLRSGLVPGSLPSVLPGWKLGTAQTRMHLTGQAAG